MKAIAPPVPGDVVNHSVGYIDETIFDHRGMTVFEGQMLVLLVVVAVVEEDLPSSSW